MERKCDAVDIKGNSERVQVAYGKKMGIQHQVRINQVKKESKVVQYSNRLKQAYKENNSGPS